MDNIEDKLLVLTETVTKVSTQMDAMQKSIDKLDGRLSKLELITKNDAEQDLKISHINSSLELGNKRFLAVDSKISNLELRVSQLENASGKKASAILNKVFDIVLAAFVGAILIALPQILSSLK